MMVSRALLVATTAALLPGLTVGSASAAKHRHRCHGARTTIVGTRGADAITGTRRRDVIVGLGGNDAISGVRGRCRRRTWSREAAFVAYARGGLDAVGGHWTDDIDYRAAEGAIDDHGPIHGKDALRASCRTGTTRSTISEPSP